MTIIRLPPIADSEKTLRWRRMGELQFARWAAGRRVRAEWVDGEVLITAADSLEHDDFGNWLRGLLRVFVAHFDLGTVHGPLLTVRLGKQRRRRLPDVLYVAKARQEILAGNHCEGAPDLIIEVVSPDSISRDWREKFLEYQKAGVREYWILHPSDRRVEAYTLVRGKYRLIEDREGKIHSGILKGVFLRTEWVRSDALPRETDVLRKWGVTI